MAVGLILAANVFLGIVAAGRLGVSITRVGVEGSPPGDAGGVAEALVQGEGCVSGLLT